MYFYSWFLSVILVFRMAGSSTNLKGVSEITTQLSTTKANLTEITWAHAVNNRTYLENCLLSDLAMLEADIVLGTLTTSENTTEIPVMGHPPLTTSDLSLEQFLARIQDYNRNSTHQKGVKLDFKTIEVFEASLTTLTAMWPNIEFPVWINADIIAGPLNATTTPVDPTGFFNGSSSFGDAVLSIGWTTNYGGNITKATYTNNHIQAMLNELRKSNPKQNITFPVRAGIAAESLENLQNLLDNVPNATLTIWSSDGDPVNIDHLRTLIFTIGIDKIYLDVPSEVSSQLNLQSHSSSSSLLPFIYLLGIVTSFFYLRLF